MAVVQETDRLGEVVQLILMERTGATVEEIVDAAKRGLVTEQQAVNALERDYAEWARHRQWREVPWAEGIEACIKDHQGSAEEMTLREQAEHLLLVVVNSLPRNHRRIFEMYEFENQSIAQIAARLHCSRQHVDTVLKEARARIARCVAEQVGKRAMSAVLSETVTLSYLMRSPFRKQKRHHPPIYPYELWRKYNAGAGWSRNGVYATRYEDKLRQYLEDCFGQRIPRVAIPKGV